MNSYNKFITACATFIDTVNHTPTADLNQLSQGTVIARKSIITRDWDEVRTAYQAFQLAAMLTTVAIEPQIENYKSDAKKKYMKAQETYTNCLANIEDQLLNLIIKSEPILPSASTDRNFDNSGHIRVPPIDIDDFYGTYETWPSFRDMFTAIFKNSTTLSEVQKLHHLRRKTKHDAARIVHKFPVEAKNFKLAWESLEQQYENKRLLVNIHIKRLLDLSPVPSESVSGIKNLYEVVKDALAALSSYDIDISQWDPLIIYLVSQNLPPDTRGLFEQTLKNHREIPTWCDLENFLRSRVLTLEVIGDGKSRPKPIMTPKSLKPNNVHTFATTTKYNNDCVICKAKHSLRQCPQFVEKSIQERQKIVRQNNLCINCLASSHQLQNCSSRFNCNDCGRRHNSLLHMPAAKTKSQSKLSPNAPSFTTPLSNAKEQPAENKTAHSYHTVGQSRANAVPHKSVILATALVKIVSNNSSHIIRSLIDPGSEATFLAESALQRLRIPARAASTRILGINSAEGGLSQKMCSFVISSLIDPTVQISVNSLVLPKLTGILPKQPIDRSSLQEINSLQLADDSLNHPGNIELVIGADLYSQVLLDGVKKYSSYVAQNSVFGWLVSGVANCPSVSSFFNGPQLDKQIEKFWESEEVLDSKPLSWEDHYCERLYQETTSRNADGRYTVQLPFKNNFPTHIFLGSSRNIALRQFLSSEKSIQKKPDIMKMYHEVLDEYLTLGHMSPASSVELTHTDHSYQFQSYYLPHHGVIKPESLTTKLRVVFNASSSTVNSFSLNDVLYAGPTLQQDLTLLILKWRKYPFVYSADIMKMYRQIWVHPSQVNYQRILHRKSPSDPVQDYTLKTVTFGVNCAPYLAIRTLLQLADDEAHNFPLASPIIKRDFYVDDVLSGGYDIPSLLEVQQQLIGLLKSGGFLLKKWSANHASLLEQIPVSDRISEDMLPLNDDCVIKALGVYWRVKDDVFTFKFQNFTNDPPFTKRKIFSNIAKLFDPAGWLSPVVVIAKILLQNIWQDKTDWDDVVEQVRIKEWYSFLSDLPNIVHITIPRWLNYRPTYDVQFHGFCDASQYAIAAAIYLRTTDSSGKVSVNLISSKTKVAPVKTISIPRLELNGAVLLAKLMKSIMTGLDLDTYTFVLWTDSTIVLAWLKQSPSRWKTFIANRVTKVLEAVGQVHWHHIRSEHNPADIASRGMSALELKSSKLWWHGPEWLGEPEACWPSLEPNPVESDLVEDAIRNFATHLPGTDDSCRDHLLTRFSSYSKALKVVAYIFRFYHNALSQLRGTTRFEAKTLSHQELKESKLCLIRLTQMTYYSSEYKQLQAHLPVAQRSPLLALNPFLDSNSIIRSNGRLAYSSLSYNEKYPILLPTQSHFVRLLVAYIHTICLHGANSLMISLIRREFWIPRLQTIVRRHIYHCTTCTILRKQTQSQIMSALPPERVSLESPFAFRHNVGLDYAGPISLKTRKGRYTPAHTTKGYVCLFVCFSTKAVHLEAVSDLTSTAFLAAFDRFTSRRGLCANLYSDNGTNFVGADHQLQREYKKVVQEGSDHTATLYSARGLHWHFIPPGTPHYGGLWEAGVKSVKHHLRRVTKSYVFTFEELATVLAKIEACLNSRPITPLTNDPSDPTCLTPGHFLIGDGILSAPETNFLDLPANSLKRWQLMQQIQQTICKRWKEEYISQLHQRPKWRTCKANVKVGDMVVLKQENLPPTEWRLGRVIELHPGKDTKVRMATIKTQHGNVTRHVVKLCVLPMESNLIASTT